MLGKGPIAYCPYTLIKDKGDCNYYSVRAAGKQSMNAVWSYEDPLPAALQIRGVLPFIPSE